MHKIVQLSKYKEKTTCRNMSFFLLFVYTLDITYQYWYRPDLLHFSFQWNEKLRFGSVEPSPATVHRTVAFGSSNLTVLFLQKEKAHRMVCFSFWRYRPDLNWRITVLQTGALPLGYGTIWKSGTRGYVPDFWSG